jgi:hypothetical protein
MRSANWRTERAGLDGPGGLSRDSRNDAVQTRGLAGVRDEGRVASALAKPQQRFAYGLRIAPELAASCWRRSKTTSYAAGIVLNHPFWTATSVGTVQRGRMSFDAMMLTPRIEESRRYRS